MKENNHLVWPDYENCLANLPNSILKKWNLPTRGSTLPLADRYLQKDYKNVVILLLDGMGKAIIESHLDKNGPFRSHLAGVYQSVFLSSTVPATTSALSGLQPCEHAWLGWDNYYPQLDKNVTVFLNVIQSTEAPAANYHVASTIAPYENVISRINRAGGHAYACTPFFEPFPDSFEKICARIKDLCKKPEKKYIYAYWPEPDGALHESGCHAEAAIRMTRELEEKVAELVGELEDTLLIVTADHGHKDCQAVVLTDYPKICDCLIRTPSLEPCVLNFFVKEDRKEIFEDEFRREFGEKFLLMPMQEVLDKQLFGTAEPHPSFRDMLGNYLAIAMDDLAIFLRPEDVLKSMHGGVSEDEVMIPLIVFD